MNRYRYRKLRHPRVTMPDDGAPPRKNFVSRKRKRAEWSPVKLEPSDSESYQAMGRRVS